MGEKKKGGKRKEINEKENPEKREKEREIESGNFGLL
jgi:hypothetical protein